MYKVFVNDKPIIITSSLKKENNFMVKNFTSFNLEEIIHKLKNNSLLGITLLSTNLEKDWQFFLKSIQVVPAAGGLVTNAKNEVLFIYRNNVWDLPKGKIEKGETIENAAVREVEEECGIGNLKLIKPLLTTYHIYYQNGNKLKETQWFLMTSNDYKTLTPQAEEGITEVIFKNKKETKEALQNSYANIKLVLETYKNS